MTVGLKLHTTAARGTKCTKSLQRNLRQINGVELSTSAQLEQQRDPPLLLFLARARRERGKMVVPTPAGTLGAELRESAASGLFSSPRSWIEPLLGTNRAG